MEKKRGFSLPVIHFRPLLIIILVVMSFAPGVIYGRVLLGSFGKAEIEERKLSLQSQALIPLIILQISTMVELSL